MVQKSGSPPGMYRNKLPTSTGAGFVTPTVFDYPQFWGGISYLPNMIRWKQSDFLEMLHQSASSPINARCNIKKNSASTPANIQAVILKMTFFFSIKMDICWKKKRPTFSQVSCLLSTTALASLVSKRARRCVGLDCGKALGSWYVLTKASSRHGDM